MLLLFNYYVINGNLETSRDSQCWNMKKVRRTGSATKMIKTVNSECFPHSLVSQQSQDFLLTAAHSSPCLSGGEQHQLLKSFLCNCGVKSDRIVCSHDDVADLLRLKGTFASQPGFGAAGAGSCGSVDFGVTGSGQPGRSLAVAPV